MRNLLTFALKAVISAALLYFAFAHVNFELIVRRLDQLHYLWLAAGVLSLVVQILLGALRWQAIVRHCKAPGEPPFSIANAARYLFVGAFFSQTLPSTVGGDAVRAWLLARDNGGWRSATYSVLIDRMIGVLTLALVVIACMPWSFALIHDATGRLALLVVGFGSVIACALFLAFGFVRWPWLERWWLTRHIASAAASARGVFGPASGGAPIIVYCLFIHATSAIAIWSLAQALAAPLALSEALFLFPPVLLIATVPLSIAGWGTREAAMVLAFGYAGLPPSDGLVVSVLFGIATFITGLPGGALWILDRGKRRREAGADKSVA